MINKKVLSVILGGGQGSRLHPLTHSRSKPAVPIAGKYRLIDVPISNCINSDIKRMFILTQFNSASLNQHIKNTYHFSFFSNAFVNLLAAEQTPKNKVWFQGTADAVRQSMHHILRHDFEYVLILSGDQLYQMNYNDMITSHIDNNAEITIGTIPVKAKEASSFGILKTATDSTKITSFIEKPAPEILPEWTSPVSDEMKAEGRDYLGSMGIYVFNRDLLINLMNDDSTVDFGKEIIPQSINKHRVYSYPFEGYWTDIGNVSSFFEANISLTNTIPKFNFYDINHRVFTRARILPTSKVTGTTLTDTIISEGCIIHASKIENSIIGIRSRIGCGTTISKCYIMGYDYYEDLEDLENVKTANKPALGIGENCHISNAIIDKDCRIGNNVIIHGGKDKEDIETDMYVIRDGIVVLKKSTIIPNGFVI